MTGGGDGGSERVTGIVADRWGRGDDAQVGTSWASWLRNEGDEGRREGPATRIRGEGVSRGCCPGCRRFQISTDACCLATSSHSILLTGFSSSYTAQEVEPSAVLSTQISKKRASCIDSGQLDTSCQSVIHIHSLMSGQWASCQ